jgi:hypothetical protein
MIIRFEFKSRFRAAFSLRDLHPPLPLLALFGPVGPGGRRPFIEVERTLREWLSTSEFDPYSDIAKAYEI